MRRYLLLAILIGAVTSGSEAIAQPKGPRLTYDEHVLPILKDKCVNCHNQDRKRGGLVLNNYTALMQGGSSGAAVKPGDGEGSLLYRLMAHLQEPIMPPSQPKLPQAQLDVVRAWIDGGAPENAGSKVVMVNKPKVDFSLASASRGKPSGPPPMPPATLSLEPVVRASRDTAVLALASSPWAPLLAVGGQKQVLLYNTDTLDLIGILPFPEGTPQVLKFSRNGSLLLAGGGQGGKSGKVVIWSVTSGERLFAVGEESDVVLAADISPDQSRIALGGPSKIVRIYSSKDGKLLHEIKKHTDWITSLEFSPDGVLLATGDRNGGLFVWEAYTAREYHTLKGPTQAITEVSWRPDSNVLAVSSEDTSIRLFEMENGNQIRTWNAHGGGSLSVRYAADGRLITTGRDRVTKLWDGNGGAQRNFEALPDIGLRAVFSHDGGRIIASDWTGTLAVWATADGKRLGTLSANPPSPAEQLALAQKVLAEKQKAAEALQAVYKASEAALNKVNADLAAAQKAVTDTAAAVKAAEVKVQQLQADLNKARTALANAQTEVQAKDVLTRSLKEAAAKVKAEAEKNKANAPLQAAAGRAATLAAQAAGELEAVQKSLPALTQAVQAIEPMLTQAQQQLTAAQAAAKTAQAAVMPLMTAQKAAADKAAADKAAADRAVAELAPAQATVARWQSALARKGK